MSTESTPEVAASNAGIGAADDGDRPFERRIGDQIRLLILAGIPVGVLVAGVGSRIAMFVLRVTSPASVVGVQSDDGFEIGRVTLSGTYNLFTLGAAVGIIGAGVYQWVRPWLLGPRWFRIATVALGSGAVVGSMLVHASGIDFVLLKPTWLAIVFFVALPALFALTIALAVEAVERRPGGEPSDGWRRRWMTPMVIAAAFPPALFVLLVAALVVAIREAVRQPMTGLMERPAAGVVIRVVWLGIAALGLVALIGDISDIRRVT